MSIANSFKHTRRVSGLFRNRSEMPVSISLALTGIAVQMYASYNLLKSENSARLRIPFLSK